MSKSTFRILKQCGMCGQMFEAQKVSTKYCSHRCSAGHYKLRLKLARKANAEAQLVQPVAFKPKTNAISRAAIREKDFLTVPELAALLGCSKPTAYKMVRSGNIKAVNIAQKKTLISKAALEKLFQ